MNDSALSFITSLFYIVIFYIAASIVQEIIDVVTNRRLTEMLSEKFLFPTKMMVSLLLVVCLFQLSGSVISMLVFLVSVFVYSFFGKMFLDSLIRACTKNCSQTK